MPLVNEIIFLIDGYTQLRKGYAEKEMSEIDTKKLLKQFGEVADDLENALYKNGIEAYEAEEGAMVDFSKQKIIRTVPTNDPEKDKTVCLRLKKGFILEDKIIRQEQVSCYKFEEQPLNKKE
jgi:molecular chaperone GrpE